MALWSALLARPSKPQQVARPSLTLFFLLVGAFVLTLVPHVIRFPYWLSVAIVAAMILRCIIEAWRLPLPSSTFCGIIALILLGFVFLQFGNVVGRDAGTALTAGLLTIKFFELRRPRDVSLIIFSCFFVIMSALLYSQVLELFIYCLIMMWVLTALLMRIQAGDLPEDRLIRLLRVSGLIFLQAFPFAVFLFFAFPRYPGPLGFQFDEATLGLSDTLTPGSIAKLSQNEADAFYVQFEPGTSLPMPSSMYWRALVLWDYNYGVWTLGERANFGSDALRVRAKPEPGEIQQTITVFAHHRRWLFGLDVPVSLPYNLSEPTTWAFGSTGHVMLLNYGVGRLDHIARYTINSSIAPVDEVLKGSRELRDAIALPDDPGDGTHPANQISPEIRALADKLHEGIPDNDEAAYINAVIHFFRHNGFTYSQVPGPQGNDWLKYFLFVNKKGFCEHYASAFAVLMRLKHVPARVVVGYLGAFYNPYKETYTVSQSNAHAWDEVWIADPNQPAGGMKGHWKRIDPTALITAVEPPDPQASQENSNANGLLRNIPRPLSFAEGHFPKWMNDGLKEIRLRRQELEINWDNLVLSYDTGVQGRLAQALGFGDKFQIGLFLSCLAAGAICLFIFRRWVHRKAPISPVEKVYVAFCRVAARRGIPRALWEGPLAYTDRVAEAMPENKAAIKRIGTIVARARYGPAPVDPSTPDALQSLLNQITASNAAATSRERR